MSKIFLSAGLCLFFLIPASGCENTKCDPCTDCPDFTGEYYAITESVVDTCDEWDLLAGNTRFRVLSQVSGEEQTIVEIEVTDMQGKWAVLQGSLCETSDEDFPKAYTFNVTYSPSETGDTGQVDYFLSGFLMIEAEEGPTTITATLNIRHFDTETGEGCDLTGNIRPPDL